MNYAAQIQRDGHLLRPNRTPKKLRTALKRSGRIKKVGAKRAKENRIYSVRRKEFLKRNPYCQIWMKIAGVRRSDIDSEGCILDGGYVFVPLATDIHHRAGRIGEKLLDEKDWIAASRPMHQWVHSHPKEARALKLLA